MEAYIFKLGLTVTHTALKPVFRQQGDIGFTLVTPMLLFHSLGFMPSKGPFRLPISITEIGHRSDFNPLKSVTYPISADREFSIEIGSVADLKFKNLEIVNKATNHGDFI